MLRFLPFKIKSGIGLLVEADNVGFDKDINLSATYAYLLDIGTSTLGIGISLGMLNKTIDPTWEIPSGDAHTPVSGDPLIPENKESYVAFDAGLGLFYQADKYYASLSVTHINQPEINYSKGYSVYQQALLPYCRIYHSATRTFPRGAAFCFCLQRWQGDSGCNNFIDKIQ